MYQVGFGGYVLFSQSFYNDVVSSWYEPGFNILFPLEVTIPKSDTAYFLLRHRTNLSGTTFTNPLNLNNLSVAATDVTTGNVITATIETNTIHTAWNTGSYTPLVIALSLTLPDGSRARHINVLILDSSTEEFITFRVLVNDDPRSFSFLTIYNQNEDNRPLVSTFGTSTTVNITRNGSYTLLTPVVSMTEVDEGTFSYPLDTLAYNRIAQYNNEEYDFSIVNASHPAINNVVKLTHVPGDLSVIVVRIDGYAQRTLADTTGQISFEVHATPKVGIDTNVDVFKFILLKNPVKLLF